MQRKPEDRFGHGATGNDISDIDDYNFDQPDEEGYTTINYDGRRQSSTNVLDTSEFFDTHVRHRDAPAQFGHGWTQYREPEVYRSVAACSFLPTGPSPIVADVPRSLQKDQARSYCLDWTPHEKDLPSEMESMSFLARPKPIGQMQTTTVLPVKVLPLATSMAQKELQAPPMPEHPLQANVFDVKPHISYSDIIEAVRGFAKQHNINDIRIDEAHGQIQGTHYAKTSHAGFQINIYQCDGGHKMEAIRQGGCGFVFQELLRRVRKVIDETEDVPALFDPTQTMDGVDLSIFNIQEEDLDGWAASLRCGYVSVMQGILPTLASASAQKENRGLIARHVLMIRALIACLLSGDDVSARYAAVALAHVWSSQTPAASFATQEEFERIYTVAKNARSRELAICTAQALKNLLLQRPPGIRAICPDMLVQELVPC